MNWKDIASAGKSVGKLDSLDVQHTTRDTMEAIMCAMAASGKVQEMALIAQTLEKVETKADLKEIGASLADLIAIMKSKETVKPVGLNWEELKAENARLRAAFEDGKTIPV